MKRISIGLAAVAVAAGLAGCASKSEVVLSQPETTPLKDSGPFIDDKDIVVASTTGPAPTRPSSPESATYDVGETFALHTWSARVDRVQLDADAIVARAASANPEPLGRYVLVTFSASYHGDNRIADVNTELTWKFTTNDGQVYEAIHRVTPFDTQGRASAVRPGGKLTEQVVFDLPPGGIEGGIVSVQEYDKRFDLAYADIRV